MKRSTHPRLIALLTLSAVVGISFLLSACGGSSGSSVATAPAKADPGAGAGPKAVEGTPVKGGSIVYGADREPTCLDPHNFGDMPQAYIGRQYLDSLVAMEPGGKAVPWLATSWDISKNGREYTFHLKEGVKFTDGTPFDAAAVKANFDQMLKPETESATNLVYLSPIYKSTEVVNPNTVKIVLKQPYSPLLDVLSQAFFGMESPKAMARGIKANCLSPVGTGPFIIKKWAKGQEIDLVRNPNYNSPPADAKNQGPAYLEKITWRFLTDPSVRYAALKSGEANLIFNIPPENYAEAASDPEIEVQRVVHAGEGHYLVLDNSEPPFNDLKVRQAFTYAANVPAAVQSAFQGSILSQTTPISSATPDYNKALAEQYPYNVAKAEALLDEAGWKVGSDGIREKDGKPLTVKFLYNSGAGETDPAELSLYQDVQAAVKEAGFDLKLVPLPEAAFFEQANTTSDYDAETTYFNSPTPEAMYFSSSAADYEVLFSNVSKVKNPELDKTLLAAAATSDPAQEKALYEKAQKIIVDNAYWVPMYSEMSTLGIEKNLKGVWIEPSDGEPVLSDAWLEG